VFRAGNVPPAPVLLVHATDHVMPVVAVNGPSGVTDRYM